MSSQLLTFQLTETQHQQVNLLQEVLLSDPLSNINLSWSSMSGEEQERLYFNIIRQLLFFEKWIHLSSSSPYYFLFQILDARLRTPHFENVATSHGEHVVMSWMPNADHDLNIESNSQSHTLQNWKKQFVSLLTSQILRWNRAFSYLPFPIPDRFSPFLQAFIRDMSPSSKVLSLSYASIESIYPFPFQEEKDRSSSLSSSSSIQSLSSSSTSNVSDNPSSSIPLRHLPFDESSLSLRNPAHSSLRPSASMKLQLKQQSTPLLPRTRDTHQNKQYSITRRYRAVLKNLERKGLSPSQLPVHLQKIMKKWESWKKRWSLYRKNKQHDPSFKDSKLEEQWTQLCAMNGEKAVLKMTRDVLNSYISDVGDIIDPQ